jgi:hypothetical protein
MTIRKDIPKSFADIERPHATVTDSFTDGQGAELLTVRLGALWSDLMRVPDERRNPDTPPRPSASLPLLDEMKGILEWD